MTQRLKLLCLAFFCFNAISHAADSLEINQELEDLLFQQAYAQFIDSIEKTWTYQYGQIDLRDDIAAINVPEGFKYLNGIDSDLILTDLWGNPPSDVKSLGMLIPENKSPMSDSTYAINITFIEDGYIEDEDAKDIDYAELLETMQDDTEAESELRVEQGYESIKLVGWASSPFYDAANKKLHWAKEYSFGDYPEHTLNYNIRILGRKGFLQLNAIGDMHVLKDVKNNIEGILNSVNFNEGHRYADFSPGVDRVAAYGIGGLIAGKMLMKAGILAKIGILLAKFWKIIVFGFIGLVAGVRKFFGGKTEEVAP